MSRELRNWQRNVDARSLLRSGAIRLEWRGVEEDPIVSEIFNRRMAELAERTIAAHERPKREYGK